jgi:hypothetical protein
VISEMMTVAASEAFKFGTAFIIEFGAGEAGGGGEAAAAGGAKLVG